MTRAEELFRLLDAQNEVGLRAVWSDDPQATDEMTRGWLRGRPALEAYFIDNLPRMSEIHSAIDDHEVRRWGDVELETFVLRQSYLVDGTKSVIEAPTTMIWHREGVDWKLALVHSVPLSTEP
jgi:hypothetical protein